VNTVFIKRHASHAGKWIYDGYKFAWENLGYASEYYDCLSEISLESGSYYIMALGSDIKDDRSMEAIKNAKRAFVYVQPNNFPAPWGTHPNFQCLCSDYYIDLLNGSDNVHLWTFAKVNSFYSKWENVKTLPLAFDSVRYVPLEDDRYKFDVCYVGGWANNGFNEKKKIMLDQFRHFKTSGLRCGFFIDKGLTHEQENKILFNSKIAINIHDIHQRELGLDVNERTFKSLGLTGFLISDDVKVMETLFPETPRAISAPHMVELVHNYLSQDLEEIKKANRQTILDNHTYIKRVQQLLELG